MTQIENPSIICFSFLFKVPHYCGPCVRTARLHNYRLLCPASLALYDNARYDVPGLVSSEGGKCITDAVDLRPRGMKAIDDDDDEYTGVETIDGSLPMTP